MINIDIVPWPFLCNSIPSFIGIDCMLCNEFNIGFVENKHFWRQQKHSVIIDLLVAKKSPAKAMLV
jgi:hypothetical protein